MLTDDEKFELITKGREDGARLFTVATSVYKFLIVMNWLAGIGGGLYGFVELLTANESMKTIESMKIAGLAIWVLTALICLVNYSVAVLSTHVAKVLVHLLFANLAIMGDKA